jgi:hypothetical protein
MTAGSAQALVLDLHQRKIGVVRMLTLPGFSGACEQKADPTKCWFGSSHSPLRLIVVPQ